MFGSVGSFLSNAVSSSLLNAVGAALGGPAGMAITQTIGRAFVADLMHNMINSLPLPQFQQNILHNVVSNALGDFPAGTGFQAVNEFFDLLASAGHSATSIASLQNDVNELQNAIDQLSNFILSTQRDSEDGTGSSQSEQAAGGAAGTGRGGWIREMAEALGEILDEIAAEMKELGENMDKDDPSTVAEFTAESQAFGIMMNAASTAIKSVGEGMIAQARKQ